MAMHDIRATSVRVVYLTEEFSTNEELHFAYRNGFEILEGDFAYRTVCFLLKEKLAAKAKKTLSCVSCGLSFSSFQPAQYCSLSCREVAAGRREIKAYAQKPFSTKDRLSDPIGERQPYCPEETQ